MNISDFYDLLSKPRVWIAAAQQLKRAAECIALQINEDLKISEAYDSSEKRYYDTPVPLHGLDVYLMGMAIENLLKGILQEKGTRSFTDVMGFGHDLVKLYKECCADCGLSEKSNEVEMLDVLTEFVFWTGRYGLPKNFQRLRGRHWIIYPTAYGPLTVLTLPNSIVHAFSHAEKALVWSIYDRFFNYVAIYLPQAKLLHPKQYNLLPSH